MRTYCGTNERCSACPIERIVDSRTRTYAADIVRFAAGEVNARTMSLPELTTIDMIKKASEGHAFMLDMPDVTPHVVGALAISAARLCKQPTN